MLRRAVPAAERDRLAGVGLALPYNLGAGGANSILPEAVAAAWNGFDLAGRLRAVLDLPVVVENDGNAIAVAELFGGHGRELDDFAIVYIGTAVGGGIVLGGAYRRGATGNAGDFGLMPVSASRLASAPRPRGPDRHPADPGLDQLADPPSALPWRRPSRPPLISSAPCRSIPDLSTSGSRIARDALVLPLLSTRGGARS